MRRRKGESSTKGITIKKQQEKKFKREIKDR